MIEIRNTSQEPIVIKLSTDDKNLCELDPGKIVEIGEYEPGMTLEYWPKYQRNLPRRGRTEVREG
jgi:hypothetical protein